jgi:membrane protease subunit (stomatin/prohibitin family)
MPMAVRQVVSTLTPDGEEIMGQDVLMWHYPHDDIINGSLLTVESNHFCILKSRGAILNVYETGQYTVSTPQHLLFGSIVQSWYGGTSPWQYEALYVSRSKMVIADHGVAYSREMAEMAYNVDYYVHVETGDDAVRLLQHMPYKGHALTKDDVNAYAGPVVEQTINQIVQLTPLEAVNEKMHDLTLLVSNHLQQFLSGYGLTVDAVKVLVFPNDERMKALIALKAFGLSPLDAVRYYTAMIMAQHGTVSAPNMAVGLPFSIGGAQSLLTADPYVAPSDRAAAPPTMPLARPPQPTPPSPTYAPVTAPAASENQR